MPYRTVVSVRLPAEGIAPRSTRFLTPTIPQNQTRLCRARCGALHPLLSLHIRAVEDRVVRDLGIQLRRRGAAQSPARSTACSVFRAATRSRDESLRQPGMEGGCRAAAPLLTCSIDAASRLQRAMPLSWVGVRGGRHYAFSSVDAQPVARACCTEGVKRAADSRHISGEDTVV